MHRFRFPRSEKIKSKKIFERTLLFGNKISSKSNKLKCSFILENLNPDSPEKNYIQIAFAINRKSGKAVWRNRVKRVLREIYRLNKHTLQNSLLLKSKHLYLIILLNRLNEKVKKKVRYKDLESDVLELFESIKKEIEAG